MTWQPQGPNAWGQPPAGPPYGAPHPHGPFGPPAPGPHGPMMKPDRSVVILMLAIGSLFVTLFGCVMCGPLALAGLGLSVPAIVMARRDLAEIAAGTRNPSGRDVTMVGMIVGIVMSVLSGLFGLVMLVIVMLYGGLIFAALATGGLD